MARSPLPALSLLLLLVPCALAAGCGGGGRPASPDPFVAQFPDEGPGTDGSPPPSLPPPTFPRSPLWSEDAVSFDTVATFGSFASDLDRLGTTFFTTDVDAVEGAGARILAIEAGGAVPQPSTRYATTRVRASDLVDSLGAPGDAAAPIGFGFYVNDLRVVAPDLGFVLANAGGADSLPTCSNLVVFDPTSGTIRQVVDLTGVVRGVGPLWDSAGGRVPGDAFTQAGAEGLEFVPTGPDRGVLFVAMSNLVFGGPSFGAVKYPGTVQVFDVDLGDPRPVAARPQAGFATRTLLTRHFNPSAVRHVAGDFGRDRVLVVVGGTTAYDDQFRLLPATEASVEVYDVASLDLVGRFDLGRVGLAGIRPALGRDAAGHAVAFLASSVLGEVYLLWIDGLYDLVVDPSRVAVLRGASNGIPIDAASAGAPGGNVAGLALSSDGRTLVASGFGDLFAWPTPKPGRLFALSLPEDLVSQPAFSHRFVAGTANVVTTSGRTLGPCAIAALHPEGPEVFVLVGGAVSPSTYQGTGPAGLGTLSTYGKIR